MRYFVSQNNSRVGPFNEDDLVTRIRAGQFPADALGWREGTANWVHLNELFPQIFALAPAPVAVAVTPVAPMPVAHAPQVVHAAAVAATATIGGLGERFIAFIIDGLILGTLNAILIPIDIAGLGLPIILNLAVTICYSGLTIGSSMQSTFGMKLFKLRVITENGAPVDMKIGFIRSLCGIFSGFVFGVGYWYAFFNDRQQTLHDKIAGTLVVQGQS